MYELAIAYLYAGNHARPFEQHIYAAVSKANFHNYFTLLTNLNYSKASTERLIPTAYSSDSNRNHAQTTDTHIGRSQLMEHADSVLSNSYDVDTTPLIDLTDKSEDP